jgi:hypothetical protein
MKTNLIVLVTNTIESCGDVAALKFLNENNMRSIRPEASLWTMPVPST